MLHDVITWGAIVVLAEWLLQIVMLVVVPLRRSPQDAKGWLLLIFFLPWLGLALFLLIGRPKSPKWRSEQLARLPEKLAGVMGRLRTHPSVFRPAVAPELSQAVALAQHLGRMPILGGSDAELLADYDGIIARLVEDIDAAEHHVHLLYYIYADDRTARRVTDALERAVRRGVRCRVLVDWLGSRAYTGALVPRLQAAGVEVHEMLPIGLFRRKMSRFDLRNHRKIAVIDGRIGYTGSQNLVNAKFKEGITYEELMVRVTGPIVLELQYVFVADWYLETDEVLDAADVFRDPAVAGEIPAQALPSGPDFPTENNQRFLVALIHGARRNVVITTPYFIPDEALLQALETAVLRGVEVHLVVSRKVDQPLVGLAQQSYYEQLLEDGIAVHRYRGKFLHAKHLTVDDAIAIIGSSNMDVRSFELNAEITLVFYDPELTARLRQQQQRYLANCQTLTLERWQRRRLAAKILQNLARLVSPLL